MKGFYVLFLFKGTDRTRNDKQPLVCPLLSHDTYNTSTRSTKTQAHAPMPSKLKTKSIHKRKRKQ